MRRNDKRSAKRSFYHCGEPRGMLSGSLKLHAASRRWIFRLNGAKQRVVLSLGQGSHFRLLDFGDVLDIDATDALALLVDLDGKLDGLLLAFLKNGHEDVDHKFKRRIVVIMNHDFIALGLLGLDGLFLFFQYRGVGVCL